MNDKVNLINEVGPGEVFDISRGISITPIVDHINGVAGGLLNYSADFKTNGGRCVFDVSATGWRTGNAGLIELKVFINGAQQVVCQAFTNEQASHKALGARRFVMPNLPANNLHTIRLERGNDESRFDENDRIDVILTELIGI